MSLQEHAASCYTNLLDKGAGSKNTTCCDVQSAIRKESWKVLRWRTFMSSFNVKAPMSFRGEQSALTFYVQITIAAVDLIAPSSTKQASLKSLAWASWCKDATWRIISITLGAISISHDGWQSQKNNNLPKLVLWNQAWCMTVLYIEFAFLGVSSRAKQMCSMLRLGKKLNIIELYERWQKFMWAV